MVGLSGGEEKIDFSILVLQDHFSAVFVGEHAQDWVVGFVFHDDVLVLKMIIFNFGGVV